MKNLHQISVLPDIPDDMKLAITEWYLSRAWNKSLDNRIKIQLGKTNKYYGQLSGNMLSENNYWKPVPLIGWGWLNEAKNHGRVLSDFDPKMIIIGDNNE